MEGNVAHDIEFLEQTEVFTILKRCIVFQWH